MRGGTHDGSDFHMRRQTDITFGNRRGRRSQFEVKLRLWAKGDGRTYNVMLLVKSKGFEPLTRTFVEFALRVDDIRLR
jgi:hypothetical protein